MPCQRLNVTKRPADAADLSAPSGDGSASAAVTAATFIAKTLVEREEPICDALGAHRTFPLTFDDCSRLFYWVGLIQTKRAAKAALSLSVSWVILR